MTGEETLEKINAERRFSRAFLAAWRVSVVQRRPRETSIRRRQWWRRKWWRQRWWEWKHDSNDDDVGHNNGDDDDDGSSNARCSWRSPNDTGPNDSATTRSVIDTSFDT